MSQNKTLDDAIQAIHKTFEEAEYQLSQLGERLQFLIGPEGEIEIVRRGERGETVRPKIVFARLAGCDPMLWRPEHPSWLRSLDPRSERAGAEGEETAAEGDDSAAGGTAAGDGEPASEKI